MYDILDKSVNYENCYAKFIRNFKGSDEQRTGCCPFHDDRHPSFSVNIKTGQFQCKACGASGNYITFRAKLDGTDNATAFARICKEENIAPPETKAKAKAKPKNEDLVAAYAKLKGFDPDWLRNEFAILGGGVDKLGVWLKEPYLDENAKEITYRKRYLGAVDARFKWPFRQSGASIPYGIWKLRNDSEDKRLLLVEGESDTQTLTLLGFRALGVPGASSFKPAWTKYLADQTVYIHVEPDKGGETFLADVPRKLHQAGFTGAVKKFRCSSFGGKDPSELFLRKGKEQAAKDIEAALHAAEEIELDRLDESLPEAIPGAPLHLRQPDGWRYDADGIFFADPQTGELVSVCRTPIIITARVKVFGSNVEKLRLAFLRDGKWSSAIFERSLVFNARSIIELSAFGMTVTSENAKQLVRFLSALESENMSKIPILLSTSHFGFHGNAFVPFSADILLDIPPAMHRWAEAYRTSGTFEDWIAAMQPHRECPEFRLMLSAAFAAPLLKILDLRSFVIYCWCNSRSGKTAMLKALQSVWGSPNELIVNFNATQVALENIAGLFCDLPMAIDERQLAGSNQELIEKIIYMLSSGLGRSRGAKDGGLRQTQTWQTIAVATGEEPLSRAASMTGVSSRVLEIQGAPFDDEKAASEMHQFAAQHFGHAGRAFIECIQALGNEYIRAKFHEFEAAVSAVNPGVDFSHAAQIAVCTFADYLASRLIFDAADADAQEQALNLAKTMLYRMKKNAPKDVNLNATEFISDWIASNNAHFGEDSLSPCFGLLSADSKTAYVVVKNLREALEGAGFSYEKTLKFLADTGRIACDPQGKRSILKRLNGVACRMVAFRLEDEPDFLPVEGTQIPFEEIETREPSV